MSKGNRLYRDPANGKLFGVCAGIANALSVDPLLVRIGAVVIGLALSWIAVIAYIVMAYALTEAEGAPASDASVDRTVSQDLAERTVRREPEPRLAKPEPAPWTVDYSDRDDIEEIEEELAAKREMFSKRFQAHRKKLSRNLKVMQVLEPLFRKMQASPIS